MTYSIFYQLVSENKAINYVTIVCLYTTWSFGIVEFTLNRQLKIKQEHCEQWVYCQQSFSRSLTALTIYVSKILVFSFCAILYLRNDTVHTARLAKNSMFKFTWVQMSQRVGECVINTVTLWRLHVAFFFQALLYLYQLGEQRGWCNV